MAGSTTPKRHNNETKALPERPATAHSPPSPPQQMSARPTSARRRSPYGKILPKMRTMHERRQKETMRCFEGEVKGSKGWHSFEGERWLTAAVGKGRKVQKLIWLLIAKCFQWTLVDNRSGGTEKNGFVTATKLGKTNNFLLLQPKILLQQPNVLLIELNILLL